MIQLGRRAFLKGSAVTVAAIMALPDVLLEGCGVATIASLAKTLGNAAAQIAVLENNPTLATKIQTDTTAAVTAILAWKSGTPAQDAVELINVLIDDINLIPVSPATAIWVNLALVTAEGILALLPSSAAPAALVARVAANHPQRRQVVIVQPVPKTASQLASQWNKFVDLNPGTQVQKIVVAAA